MNCYCSYLWVQLYNTTRAAAAFASLARAIGEELPVALFPGMRWYMRYTAVARSDRQKIQGIYSQICRYRVPTVATMREKCPIYRRISKWGFTLNQNFGVFRGFKKLLENETNTVLAFKLPSRHLVWSLRLANGKGWLFRT